MTEKQEELLRWILHEWDCLTVEEAKAEAMNDPQLHMKLREAGITFEKPQ